MGQQQHSIRSLVACCRAGRICYAFIVQEMPRCMITSHTRHRDRHSAQAFYHDPHQVLHHRSPSSRPRSLYLLAGQNTEKAQRYTGRAKPCSGDDRSGAK